MPLFEYRCRDCRQHAEILVRNGERPICPDCGSNRLDKLLSAANGRTVNSLPVTSPCPPPDSPPCGPGCCRL